MFQRASRRIRVFIAASLLGASFFLGGCDPTLRATTEQGIINLSTTALSSVFAALIELATEANQ